MESLGSLLNIGKNAVIPRKQHEFTIKALALQSVYHLHSRLGYLQTSLFTGLSVLSLNPNLNNKIN